MIATYKTAQLGGGEKKERKRERGKKERERERERKRGPLAAVVGYPSSCQA